MSENSCSVELLDAMGDDLTVVNAARVSVSKEKDVLDDKDIRLLYFLGRGMPRVDKRDFVHRLCDIFSDLHNDYTPLEDGLREAEAILEEYRKRPMHWTPFAHVQLRFRMTMPIYVARQWFRHTAGLNRNEMSRRYVGPDVMPDYYAPDDGGRGVYGEACDNAVGTYRTLTEEGIMPREQARGVLPQSTYTMFIETGSLAAYARIVGQRLDVEAQDEIRAVARKVNRHCLDVAPISWRALNLDKNEDVPVQ